MVMPPSKLYNHVQSLIIGPDIGIHDGNDENTCPLPASSQCESEPKRSSGVEPTLDPTKVLTALIANNNGQLPPYQL